MPHETHRLRRDVFPVEAVRDLLGIARALYRAERTAGASPERLAALQSIGTSFKKAIELAAKSPVASLGMTAAWRRADEATEALCGLIGDAMPAGPLVRAAAELVRGKR